MNRILRSVFGEQRADLAPQQRGRSNSTLACFGLALALLQPQLSIAQGIIRIAQLEPLSGPFQTQGEANVWTLQAAVEEFNARSKDVKFEVTPYDAKGNAQEALNIFRQAMFVRFHGIGIERGRGAAGTGGKDESKDGDE